jgi:hypothetical protein
MKKLQLCSAIIAAFLLLSSCSYFEPSVVQLKPPAANELRLTSIEMPDYIREDLNYDVVIRYSSEETPQITRVCFRWLAVPISSASPSLNCYAANGDFGTGNLCYTRTSSTGAGSSSFCVGASDIRADVPERLIVRIRPTSLQAGYNIFEGQAEYVADGQLRMTNPVKTPVKIDKSLDP